MRPDIGQDAAIALAVEEPVWPRVVADGVRPQPHRVHHVADGARLYQFPGLHRRARLEMLGVTNRIDPPGLRLHGPQFGELRQRGHPRLVAHHVLAVPHRGNRYLGALIQDGRRRHQRNRLVLEYGPPVSHPLGLRILLRERHGEVVLWRIEGHELRPLPQQAIDLPVDMAVVEADGGELDGHGGLLSQKNWGRAGVRAGDKRLTASSPSSQFLRSAAAGRTGRTRRSARGSARSSRTARHNPIVRWSR